MKLRLTAFLLGILLMGIGIAIITKVNLGTSPISTVPYVISYILPGSFGFWTVVLSFIFIAIQMILLRTVSDRMLYLQILISPLLGIALDIGMWLFQWYIPGMIFSRIVILVIGCFVLALGIYLQIQAKLVMNAGESIVQLLSQKMNKPFSTIKIGFDWTLVGIATVIGVVCLQTPVGIGLGTLLSAVLVGYCVKLIYQWQLIQRIPILKNISY